MSFHTRKIVNIGIISALYIVLSLIVLPFSSGAVQFRPSEALTLLPLIVPESAFALFIGCFLFNLISGCALFDCIFGSLITLLSAFCTLVIGKKIKSARFKILIGGFFPALFNALLLPLVWLYCYGTGKYVYVIQTLILLLSQSLSVYLLGTPLILFLTKHKDNLG